MEQTKLQARRSARKEKLKKFKAKQSEEKVFLVRQTSTGTEGFNFLKKLWENPETEKQISVVEELKRRKFKVADGSKDYSVRGYSTRIELKATKKTGTPQPAST